MKYAFWFAVLSILVLITGNLNQVEAYEAAYKVSPGSVQPKSIYLEKGATVSYGINVRGGQNHDIVFTIADPYGYNIYDNTIYKYHRSDFTAQNSGNYVFYFDNKMSSVSTKDVRFDWNIIKPSYGFSTSQSGGTSIDPGWLIFFLVIIGSAIGGGIAAAKRKKRMKQRSSKIDEDDKSYSEKPPKKSFGKRCWHSDSWVREDNMEICSSCGKELGKLVEKGNKTLSSFSGTPKEKSKPVESQQNLDSYVAQSSLDNSVVKETINDIEKNEKALGILKERLAKGEISVNEYQEIKKELS